MIGQFICVTPDKFSVSPGQEMGFRWTVNNISHVCIDEPKKILLTFCGI